MLLFVWYLMMTIKISSSKILERYFTTVHIFMHRLELVTKGVCAPITFNKVQ